MNTWGKHFNSNGCTVPMDIEVLCVSCKQYYPTDQIKQCGQPDTMVCLPCYNKLKKNIWTKHFHGSQQVMCPSCTIITVYANNFELGQVGQVDQVGQYRPIMPVCSLCSLKN